MKRQVFAGLNLVLSGLVALGSQPHDSEYWKLAETFGAHCLADLSKQTTHVVAKEVSLPLYRFYAPEQR